MSYLATANLDGPNSLPRLGALAAADIVVDTGLLTTFFHQATGEAQGTQRYFYTGLVPATYTLDYVLEGGISGGIFSGLASINSSSLSTLRVRPFIAPSFPPRFRGCFQSADPLFDIAEGCCDDTATIGIVTTVEP